MPVTVARSVWPSYADRSAVGVITRVRPLQVTGASNACGGPPAVSRWTVAALADAQSMSSLNVIEMSSPNDSVPSAGCGVPNTCGAARSMTPVAGPE